MWKILRKFGSPQGCSTALWSKLLPALVLVLILFAVVGCTSLPRYGAQGEGWFSIGDDREAQKKQEETKTEDLAEGSFDP